MAANTNHPGARRYDWEAMIRQNPESKQVKATGVYYLNDANCEIAQKRAESTLVGAGLILVHLKVVEHWPAGATITRHKSYDEDNPPPVLLDDQVIRAVEDIEVEDEEEMPFVLGLVEGMHVYDDTRTKPEPFTYKAEENDDG